MEYLVSNCNDCPLIEYVEECAPECGHPGRLEDIVIEYDEGHILPNECPLRKEPLTVKLKT
jgi:hypothetical protein